MGDCGCNQLPALCVFGSRMGGGSVKDVQSKKELDEVVGGGAPVIVHFWASWCEASKHMDQLVSHLSTDFPHAHFLRVRSFFSSILFHSHSQLLCL